MQCALSNPTVFLDIDRFFCRINLEYKYKVPGIIQRNVFLFRFPIHYSFEAILTCKDCKALHVIADSVRNQNCRLTFKDVFVESLFSEGLGGHFAFRNKLGLVIIIIIVKKTKTTKTTQKILGAYFWRGIYFTVFTLNGSGGNRLAKKDLTCTCRGKLTVYSVCGTIDKLKS